MNYRVIGLKDNIELNSFFTKKEAINWVSEVLSTLSNLSFD